MRRLALFITLAVAWTVLPSAAQATFADCLGPDTHGPIMYDFTPGPNPDPLAPGTLIQITVDDRPSPQQDGWANWINNVKMRIDDQDAEDMKPESGRFTRVRDVFYRVVPIADMAPGFHTLTFTATDDCNKEGVEIIRVLHLTPAATAVCQGFPPFCP